MDVVTLKNGAEAAKPLVAVVSVALHKLLADDAPLALYDAVVWARTGKPQPYSADRLEAFGLIQNGVMHQATAEIVAASAVGEDLEMVLVNPVDNTIAVKRGA